VKTEVYGSRRTRADIEALKADLYAVVEENQPMTVRQVFYQMVSRGLIEKTEAEYKRTVVRLLTVMRISRELPFSWIADNTRWQRKPRTYSSLEAAIQNTAECYRRCLWDDQDVHVEIWLEKDALAGVLYEETGSWDVPLYVTRGYPSVSYLYGAAELIEEEGKPAHLYYFGDYDPSGLDIPRNVEERLREFAPEAEIEFTRVAVTPDQIASMGLPTRPTKKTDSRSEKFGTDESVEVDAIPPKILREMVSSCITQHVDGRALEVTQIAEEEERKALAMFARHSTVLMKNFAEHGWEL
jgi:hypothetical protein